MDGSSTAAADLVSKRWGKGLFEEGALTAKTTPFQTLVVDDEPFVPQRYNVKPWRPNHHRLGTQMSREIVDGGWHPKARLTRILGL